MKITRICKMETKEFKEGDQITVGKYTATCVKVDGKDCIFLLDQYLDKPFTHKNLIPELNEHLLEDENFKEINDLVRPQDFYDDGSCVMYRVPFAGEMFSGTEEDEWIRKNYEPDTKEGFLDIWECMKDRRNRIAIRKDKQYEWGWLMNRKNYSATYFALGVIIGFAIIYNASASRGVRPVFVLNGIE